MKIVSLLPSATEIICSLGLSDDLVGVTHECDYPASVKFLPRVTRTSIPADASSEEIDRLVREQLQSERALYSLDMPLLEKLQPDLIVTQSLCNVCAVATHEVQQCVDRLSSNPTVLNLEPMSLGEVFQAIMQVADVTDTSEIGASVVRELIARVEAVKSRVENMDRRPRVAFLEWLIPPFSAGHWNPELIRLAGGIDVLGEEGKPSRTLTWAEVFASEPDEIVIACCGFDVERTKQDVAKLPELVPGWRELRAVSEGRVHIRDGSQYFNRPGPRLVDSLEILAYAIRDDAASDAS